MVKAEAFHEVDSERIFAIGTSLGGIRASLALSIEPRLKKTFVYVAGGNLPEILAYSKVKIIQEYKRAKMAELGLTSVDEYLKALNKVVLVDPLNFANESLREDIFMVIAKRDKKVPYENQLDLFKAFGKPRHVEVNSGHRIVGSRFLYKMQEASNFFEAH